MTTRMRHDFDAGSDQSAATLRTVRAYHAGWVRKDFDAAAVLLAPDLVIEVPINEYPTRESFVAALTAFGSITKRVDLLDAFAHGPTAMLLFDMEVAQMGTLRVAEHFTVEGGLIRKLRQIHDTHPVRQAMARSGA